MLSARFELAIFRVSGERIDQLSHESARNVPCIDIRDRRPFDPYTASLTVLRLPSKWLPRGFLPSFSMVLESGLVSNPVENEENAIFSRDQYQVYPGPALPASCFVT